MGVQLSEAPGIVAIPLSLAAGMLAGAVWGFIPGFLKATRGAHEVVTTIMLNFIAIAFLAFMVSGPLNVEGSPSPVTVDVGNAALPIILGRNGHIGILLIPIMAALYGFLLFRTTRGFEIRVAGASPDAARYAGMSPRRLIIWTMSVAGMLAGLAGATELLGTTHYMTASYGTTVGFDAIAVALLGRTNPIGIVLAALLFGAMHAAAHRRCRSRPASRPSWSASSRRRSCSSWSRARSSSASSGLKGARSGLEDTGTFTSTYGGEAKIA